MRQYLKVLFNESESVCSGNMYSVELRAQTERLHGPFISINPLKIKRADENVTSHRNFLLEIDDGTSIDEQIIYINELKVPYSSIVFSGGKSAHFILALDEDIGPEKYRQYAKALCRAVPRADRSTKNPSRFTRLPGHFRADTQRMQELLYCGERISHKKLLDFVAPFIEVEQPNYRQIYNDFMGLQGQSALHPLTLKFISGEHPCSTGRNNALYKSAADLRDNGFSIGDAFEKLGPPAELLGLPKREIDTCIHSAYSKIRR